jgi:aryl-alcohol dehydrogenase-like predicted oxidoreductase
MIHRRAFVAAATLAAIAPLMACRRATPASPSTTDARSTIAPPFAFTGPLQTRAIPSTGETLPVIGMGTSVTFEIGRDADARVPLREVLAMFAAAGGKVVDTAPTYSSAEDVLGDLVAEQRLRDRLFLATKLSRVTGRDAGLAQFGTSLRRLRTDKVGLLQVHNLQDTDTQMGVARELKQQGLPARPRDSA